MLAVKGSYANLEKFSETFAHEEFAKYCEKVHADTDLFYAVNLINLYAKSKSALLKISTFNASITKQLLEEGGFPGRCADLGDALKILKLHGVNVDIDELKKEISKDTVYRDELT